jgi:hypothetical protein
VYASRARRKQGGCFETSSPPDLLFKKKIKDEEEEERARATIENLANEPITQRVADNAERIVRELGKWPSNGWNASETRSEIARLLGCGVAQQVIIDTVRVTAARAPGRIKTFRYFRKEIEAVHHDVTAQATLPLGPAPIRGGRNEPSAGSAKQSCNSDTLRALDAMSARDGD